MKRDEHVESKAPASRRGRSAAAVSAIINWYGGLSEPARVILGAAAVLAAVFLPIVAIVYRAVIWNALVVFLAVIAVAGVLGFLTVATVSISRARRAAREHAELLRKSTADAARREHDALLHAIDDGTVRPLTDPGRLLLRNSEVLWFRCLASTDDGRGSPNHGELYVTSMRIVFLCAENPVEIPIGEINALDPRPGTLQVISKTSRKTEEFRLPHPQIAAAHIRRCVQAYHRQIDVGFESDRDRRVPQDVKTAVWQRDGGQCVQCGATDYLEFDHIIPFSKGGASTVDNVQLLCRRCNARKGAAI